MAMDVSSGLLTRKRPRTEEGIFPGYITSLKKTVKMWFTVVERGVEWLFMVLNVLCNVIVIYGVV